MPGGPPHKYVGYVVVRVPGVKGQHAVERHRARFGVDVPSLPVLFRHTAHQNNPALVQAIEQSSAKRRWACPTTIIQSRPGRFIVRFDDRIRLGERQLETNVRVHVAVGNMMHDLANGPSAFAIRGVELRLAESPVTAARNRAGADATDVDIPRPGLRRNVTSARGIFRSG